MTPIPLLLLLQAKDEASTCSPQEGELCPSVGEFCCDRLGWLAGADIAAVYFDLIHFISFQLNEAENKNPI